MQDLLHTDPNMHSTAPTQETCPTVVAHAGYTTPTRKLELDYADQERVFPEKASS